MVGFYGYEIVCLVIFGTTAIVLLIFFLPKDPFLIVEIILMTFLIIIDGVIIALEFVDMDDTTSTQTYVFLWIGTALWASVLYFRIDQYWFKITRQIHIRKYNWVKKTKTPL